MAYRCLLLLVVGLEMAMTAFDKNAERVPCYVCDGTGQSSEHDRCYPPNYYECDRCNGKGTVLVDTPCVNCGGDGLVCDPDFDPNTDAVECHECNGTGCVPRSARMDRLMREADHFIRMSTDATERIAFIDGFGASGSGDIAAPWQEDRLKMAAFTGYSVADWEARKGAQ